jgi:RNA processing factor Prp31
MLWSVLYTEPNIPGRPYERTRVNLPSGTEDDDDTVGTEMDTLMTSVEECYHDMKRLTKKVEQSLDRSQRENAAKLEEVIVQMYRAMAQVTPSEQGRLWTLQQEMQQDIARALTAMEQLAVRMDRLGGRVDDIDQRVISLTDQVARLEARWPQQQQQQPELRQQIAPQVTQRSHSSVTSPSTPTIKIALSSAPPLSTTTTTCRRALSGSYDRTLRVWDLDTG